MDHLTSGISALVSDSAPMAVGQEELRTRSSVTKLCLYMHTVFHAIFSTDGNVLSYRMVWCDFMFDVNCFLLLFSKLRMCRRREFLRLRFRKKCKLVFTLQASSQLFLSVIMT